MLHLHVERDDGLGRSAAAWINNVRFDHLKIYTLAHVLDDNIDRLALALIGIKFVFFDNGNQIARGRDALRDDLYPFRGKAADGGPDEVSRYIRFLD